MGRGQGRPYSRSRASSWALSRGACVRQVPWGVLRHRSPAGRGCSESTRSQGSHGERTPGVKGHMVNGPRVHTRTRMAPTEQTMVF